MKQVLSTPKPEAALCRRFRFALAAAACLLAGAASSPLAAQAPVVDELRLVGFDRLGGVLSATFSRNGGPQFTVVQGRPSEHGIVLLEVEGSSVHQAVARIRSGGQVVRIGSAPRSASAARRGPPASARQAPPPARPGSNRWVLEDGKASLLARRTDGSVRRIPKEYRLGADPGRPVPGLDHGPQGEYGRPLPGPQELDDLRRAMVRRVQRAQ